MNKHQVVNEELLLCSRVFLVNQTAEEHLIKKSVLAWEPKTAHFC